MFTDTNIDFGAIFVTKGRCATQLFVSARKGIQYCMNIASSSSFLIFTIIFNAEGEIQPSRLLAPRRQGHL